MDIWEYGNKDIWEYGYMEMWKCGYMGMTDCFVARSDDWQEMTELISLPHNLHIHHHRYCGFCFLRCWFVQW